MRIVSLLPSATEFICSLGLRDQLVGVSHECDYPPSVRGLPVVTKTRVDHDASSSEIDTQVRRQLESEQALYSLEHNVLEALAPDLIVTQSLCDVCAVAASEVAALAGSLARPPAVYNLQPMNLTDVIETCTSLAQAADVPAAGHALRDALVARIDAVRDRTSAIDPANRPTAVFLEWLDPPFNAGHWTPELIGIGGGRSLLGAAGEASRTITWDAVAEARPQRIIIGCCGFDIDRARSELDALLRTPGHPAAASLGTAEVSVVDGNAYFNRPGPRLVDSLELVAHVLHPARHPLPGTITPALAWRRSG